MPFIRAAIFTAAVCVLVAAPSARTMGQGAGQATESPVRTALSDMALDLVR